MIENCTNLGNYAASSVNVLPKFRDNLSVPYSRAKNLRGFFNFSFHSAMFCDLTLVIQNSRSTEIFCGIIMLRSDTLDPSVVPVSSIK